MTPLSTLIYRLRLKLKDIDAITYSKYDVSDALNETLLELNLTVTKFYIHLNFRIPNDSPQTDGLPINYGESIVSFGSGNLAEDDETGWPPAFDGLIIEYCLILLSPGDYGTKEQAKILWQEKVLKLASTFNIENNLIEGFYGNKSNKHSRTCRCCHHG